MKDIQKAETKILALKESHVQVLYTDGTIQ